MRSSGLEKWCVSTAEELSIADEVGTALFQRVGWLSRPTVNGKYVNKALANADAGLPELLAEEARLRRLYGGKGLGILYLECRAEELGYRVPPFELIPATVFDDFLSYNGFDRRELSRRYSSGLPREWETDDPFLNGQFSPWSEKILRDAFVSLREQMNGAQIPLVSSSSSELEDSGYCPFEGVYLSRFMPVTGDEEYDFREFRTDTKWVFISIFSPRAREYREQYRLPDEDRMAVAVKHMVGNGGVAFFDPEFSGVSYQNPYLPRACFHDVNRGLNTTTVRGLWALRFSSLETVDGTIERSGTMITADKDAVRSYFEPAKRFLGESRLTTPPRLSEFRDKELEIDETYRSFVEERGPVKVEWSVPRDRTFMPYQLRPSASPARALWPVSVECAKEDLIVEGAEILGHGEITLPVIGFANLKDVHLDPVYRRQEFMLIGDVRNFDGQMFVELGEFHATDLRNALPGLRGFINLSIEVPPLAAHWSEPIIKNNILVITVPALSDQGRALIEKITAQQPESENGHGKMIITEPVRMAVDARKQRGVVHVI